MRNVGEVYVRLTLAEAEALRNATGFGGPTPSTPRELAALERGLDKIESASSLFRRQRRRRRV